MKFKHWKVRQSFYLSCGSADDTSRLICMLHSWHLFLTIIRVCVALLTIEAQEETGWKLVHGDVFRPPTTMPLALCVMTGTGAQIGSAFFFTMVCAMLKLLNPMKKGATLTAILILYVLSGSVAGYVSSRMYKFCNATDWKFNTVITGMCSF